MRLIDADAMHKFVEDKVAEGKDGWAKGVGYEWAWTLTAVDAQPTIDAVPVVHGYWDDSGRYRFQSGKKAIVCNMCGCALSVEEYNLFNWNYCPVCGAKMDGDS